MKLVWWRGGSTSRIPPSAALPTFFFGEEIPRTGVESSWMNADPGKHECCLRVLERKSSGNSQQRALNGMVSLERQTKGRETERERERESVCVCGDGDHGVQDRRSGKGSSRYQEEGGVVFLLFCVLHALGAVWMHPISLSVVASVSCFCCFCRCLVNALCVSRVCVVCVCVVCVWCVCVNVTFIHECVYPSMCASLRGQSVCWAKSRDCCSVFACRTRNTRLVAFYFSLVLAHTERKHTHTHICIYVHTFPRSPTRPSS